MLVLSRKKLESIRIGDEIEVVVLEVGKNRVRLGFRCPSHVAVTRSELIQFDREMVLDMPVETADERELVCA
ncbi:carbon storage regulator [Planctomicrobium piriforme]|uniref:Translational regulator CsrA n=1 Tax=Planctomicrobium piriforme TaxID=1576369 RepID=A0A1I3CE30_9PLAN|nr:carbon storage regulator [Planctomicrobium piriforme]SFH72663.1 carbon storage regulator (csrA) [Planctomicrobium piriforme]